MALAVADNPPELFLGSANATLRIGEGSEVSPEIFGALPWAVALVGSQKEKTIARWLHDQAVPYFLPMTRSNTAGTRNTIYTPVFDGVIFFQAHNEEVPEGFTTHVTPLELEVRRHRHCYDVLKTAVQRKFKRELAFLACEDRDHRTIRPEKDYEGENVIVTAGPFKGFEGIGVVEEGRLKVKLHFVGRLMSVEVPPEYMAFR